MKCFIIVHRLGTTNLFPKFHTNSLSRHSDISFDKRAFLTRGGARRDHQVHGGSSSGNLDIWTNINGNPSDSSGYFSKNDNLMSALAVKPGGHKILEDLSTGYSQYVYIHS